MTGREKNIVLTGASGLVGHGILDLVKGNKEYAVTGIYQTYKPFIEADNITFIQGDFTVKEGWNKLWQIPADVLIHCAAIIPLSVTDIMQKEAKNCNLFMDEFAISYVLEKKAKLIFISSTGVYGFNIRGLCDENSEISPASEYFAGKIETERNVVSMKGMLEYHILRISAPYGPYQRHNTVIKVFMENALKGKPILYYGTGSRMQDFIYVKDIALACLKALNCENYGIYNIASSSPITMKNLAVKIKKISGSASEIKEAGIPDPQEGHSPIFDISKAGRLLGWKPQYTLDMGLAELIGYLRRK